MSDAKMAKIQKLLDVAEHPDTNPAMARNYREQAERLMVQYAIDEAQLAKLREAEGVEDKPESRTIRFCQPANPVMTQYYNLMIQIAEHNRCKFTGWSSGEGVMVGFPKDMDFAELMYASVRLQMMNKVEPKPDHNKSFDENVWWLHECGVKWESIALQMNLVRMEHLERMGLTVSDVGAEIWEWVPWDAKKKDGGRLIRAAKRYCRENGLPYIAIAQPTVHLRSYAQGFLHEVMDRLKEMRAHQQDEIKSTSGAELVLVGRADKVEKLYDDLFGKIKNKPSRQRITADQYYRGKADGRNADLSGGRNNISRNSKELG